MINRAIRILEPGDAGRMTWEEVPMPEVGAGEVLLRHTAIGVNYIDVYHRSGIYPVDFPLIPGMEAVGVVEAIGEGVEGIQVGDRVAYCKGVPGAYSIYRTIKVDYVIKVPEGIGDVHAAAAMLKGQTAHYLLKRIFVPNERSIVMVTAAAGGVGLFLCQWAKALGATVIGTVGSEEKAGFAKENGCDHPILYKQEDVVAKVREVTGGLGCNVVYDSVGAETYMQSIDCLQPYGLLVSFGQSSGVVPPIDPFLLMQKGSLFFTRPSLFHYKHERVEYLAGAGELFEMILSGQIQVHIGQTYYLKDAALAHQELEAGRTHGSTVLLVDD